MDNLQNMELNYPQIPCNCQFQETSQYINIQSIKEDEVFICDSCVIQENNIPKYLLIHKIIQNLKNDFFMNWPYLDDKELIQQVRYFSSMQNFHYKKNEQIETFFKNFGDEFIKTLESFKKIILKNQDQIFEDSSNLLEYYQNISQLVELKNIITDQESSKQQKSNKIFKIITKKQEESTESTNKIKQMIEKINLHPQVNLEILNSLKQTILSNINSISSKQSNDNEYQLKIKQNSNLDNIIKLISNQSNFCNQKYLESVKNELLKIQDSINILNIEKDVYLNDDLVFQQKKDIIQEVMRNYPIFEIAQIVKKHSYQFEIDISTYNNSKQKSKVTIDNDGNQKFEVIQTDNCISYVKIKYDCLYKLIIKLELKNESNKHFFVGLIGQSHKNNKYIYEKSSINSFTTGSIHGDRGVSKIVKGKCLRDVKYPDEYNQIEIAFCAKNKFFQVSDYPKKENINEINDDKLNLIDKKEEYFLGFELYFMNDSMTILEFQEIE
ncbi:hypothetical protein ABPG74_019164 [Tetrahymena malaccensis]